jgi:hypothetical protein
MTGEALHRGVLGDEADVAVVAGMKSAEGDVLERVKVIDTWSTLSLFLDEERIH